MQYAFVLLLGVLSTILGGYDISTQWNWFVASQFHLQQLTTNQGIGISFVVSALFIGLYVRLATILQKMRDKDDVKTSVASDMMILNFATLLSHLMILLSGFIWHWVMYS